MRSAYLRHVWLLTGILLLCVTVMFGCGRVAARENPSKTEADSEKHSETNSGNVPGTPDDPNVPYEPDEEPDTPYELIYTSNGDGTCYVSSVRFRADCQEPLTLVFPEISPAGERVISVDYPVSSLIPEVIAKEDFVRHIAEPMAELLGADSFYYKQFKTYFQLKDPAIEESEPALEAMYLQYPLARATPVYVLISDASLSELNRIEWYLSQIGYTSHDTVRDYRHLRDLGRAAGVTDWDGFLSNIVCYPGAVKAMTFPQELENLNKEVYISCPSLESLVLPGCAEIPNRAFAYSALREVTLGEGVTRIGAQAFYACDALSSISLPDSLKEIGEQAFCGCEALTDINLPSGLTELGSGAFDLCTELRDIGNGDAVYLGDETNPHLLLLCVRRDIPLFSVNAGTRYIYANTFDGCGQLTEVEIPEGVASIGSFAFRGCGRLTELVVPESVVSIGSDAFQNCGGMERVILPKRLERVGSCLFQGCESLRSLTLPEGMSELVYEEFLDCKALAEIILPASLCRINSYAFRGCESLKSLVIPEGVTEMESGAFADCAIETVVLPAGMDRLSDSFRYCSFLTRLVIPETVTYLESGAFYGCECLNELVLPQSLKSIGPGTFDGCKSLTVLSIPGGVKTVYRSAFENSGLTELFFSGTLDEWECALNPMFSDRPIGIPVRCTDGDTTV